ncbi:MAG: hypothetical protein EKK33_22975 [Bradyrhizobiaceae bacterium]|nr:MAG: hypothetical protein EKK33_22975 [Bradyrhizobiaceae bacterium]
MPGRRLSRRLWRGRGNDSGGGVGRSASTTSVIARSSCDEAIQTASADTFLDCFAALAMTRGEPTASPAARP